MSFIEDSLLLSQVLNIRTRHAKDMFHIKTYYLLLRGSISIETTIDGQDFNRMSIIKSAILNKEAQLQLRLKSNYPRES
jgi:hypothetical protein